MSNTTKQTSTEVSNKKAVPNSTKKNKHIQTLEPVNLSIDITPQMTFSKKSIHAKEGQTVHLIVKNKTADKKEVMWHNWVLLKKGVNVSKFAQKAVKDENYPLTSSDVIIATKTLGGGDTQTLTFKVPTKGKYKFICTFPGHYLMMNGDLIVE